MGVQKAWENGYTGRGITIAIVDDGIEYNNTDLIPNYKSGYDVLHNSTNPFPSSGYTHGTECAGVALAAKNNICTIGIAFNGNLVGIRLIGNWKLDSAMKHNALLRFGTHIYSNSWDLPVKPFEDVDNLVNSALEKGIKQGRKGLGSVYVWGVSDNCNADGFVNNIYTIGVGSVTKRQTPLLTKPCSAIMVSAYGGGDGSNDFWTTSTNNKCVNSFNRTSAATSIVAGILGLTLEANPRLTWRDIQHLIVNTSDLSLLQNGDTKTNGAGRKVSDYYGFGLINAERLTNDAKIWQNVRPQRTCSQSVKKVGRSTTPTSYNISSYYNASACANTTSEVLKLEHVQVSVKFKYAKLRAVTFNLTSPSGTTSHLLTQDSDKKVNGTQEWTFLSVRFWDENPVGIWILNLWIDPIYYYNDHVQLIQWNMTFYGTTIEAHYPNLRTTTTTQKTVTNKSPSSSLKQTTVTTNNAASVSHGTTNNTSSTSSSNIQQTSQDVDNESNTDSKVGIIIGCVLGSVALGLLGLCIGCFIHKWKANNENAGIDAPPPQLTHAQAASLQKAPPQTPQSTNAQTASPQKAPPQTAQMTDPQAAPPQKVPPTDNN
ncbi:hypothetical protein ACF0H5_015793 [Mactra antiquata]